MCVAYWQVVHVLAPGYLGPFTRVADLSSRRSLRSVFTNRLVVPTSRLSTVGSRAFPVAGTQTWNDLPEDVTSAESLAEFRRLLKTHLFRKFFSWLLAGHQLTVSGRPSSSSASYRPPNNLLIDWLNDWLIITCSDWTRPAIGAYSSYAVMTSTGVVSTCRHADSNTSSSCRRFILSSTWPYWSPVNIQSSRSARTAGGPLGLPMVLPSTTRRGHAHGRNLPTPQATRTISRPTGFHSDSVTRCRRICTIHRSVARSTDANSVVRSDERL